MSKSLARSLDRLPLAGHAGAVRCLPHSQLAGKRAGSTGACSATLRTPMVADGARAASPSRGCSSAGKVEVGRRLELLESCVANNWQEFSAERRELHSKLAELMAMGIEPRDRESDHRILCADLERRVRRCEGLRDAEAAACQALALQVSELRAVVEAMRREVSDFKESTVVAATPRSAVRAVERTETCLNEEMRRLQGEAARAAELAVESAKAATARSNAEGDLSQICFGAERDLERIHAEALGQAKAMVERQWRQLQAKTAVPIDARADKQCEMLLKSHADTMQVVQDLEGRMDRRGQSKHSEQIGALLAVETHMEHRLQGMRVDMVDSVKSLEAFAERMASRSHSEVAVMDQRAEMKIEASARACRIEVSDYLQSAGDRLECSWTRNREEASSSWEVLEAMVKDRLDASRIETVECAEALAANTKCVKRLQKDVASVLDQRTRAMDVRLEEGLASQAAAFVEKARADGEKREEEKARVDALEGILLNQTVSAELAEVRAAVDETFAATAASARSQAQLAASLVTAESAKSEAKLVSTLEEGLERMRADSAFQASEASTAAKDQVEQIMRANEEHVVSLAASARCLQDELSWLQQDVSAINDCQGDAQNRVDGAITELTDCLALEVRETQRRLSAEETAVASEHRALRRELEEHSRGLARLECESALLEGPRETLCKRLFPAEEDGRVDELLSTVEKVAEEAGRDNERCEIWARRAHRELESEHSALCSEFRDHARSLVDFESRAEETSRAAEATRAQVAELTATVDWFAQHVAQNEAAQSARQCETMQHVSQSQALQRSLQTDTVQPSLERSFAPVEDLAAQARAIDDDEVLELASVLEQLSRETRQRGGRAEFCHHPARPVTSEISPETRLPSRYAQPAEQSQAHVNGIVQSAEQSQAHLSGGACRNMPWQDMLDIQGALGLLQVRSSPAPLRIPGAH